MQRAGSLYLPFAHERTSASMYPAAVIFDFDGVIVDTEPIHYQAFQKILEPRGMGYTWQEYTDKYMGFDDRDAFKEAFHVAGQEVSQDILQLLIKQKAAIFEEVITQGVTPYQGVIELIQELVDHGIPLAISSGALRSDIIPILEQLKIKDNFTHIVTADDVPQSKPNPASYIGAKEKLLCSYPHKLDSNSIIYAIEDTPAGIQSAKGAGLIVIAVSNSYPASKLQQADSIVHSLSQLSGGNWM